MSSRVEEILSLVKALPELYQPIFQHSEFSGGESRSCADRLQKISQACGALCGVLGRPLKILDLGCAQGYFSLSLALLGHEVHGIDLEKRNIDVCQALAKEHSFSVEFSVSRIEDFIQEIQPGEYDVVLGLSVFHHIIHAKGQAVVSALLQSVLKKAALFIVEFALPEEPLYWASSQPVTPRLLLDSAAFLSEVGRFATHLSDIKRPLYLSSDQYWVLDDLAEKIERWSYSSHQLVGNAAQKSRRYFFGKHYVVKQYSFNHPLGETNKLNFKKEAFFASNVPEGFPAFHTPLLKQTANEAWVVMERLRGHLLLDLIVNEVSFDEDEIINSVLDQLVVLEAAGLFHHDLRTWNVFVTEDGSVRLIDYASIGEEKSDCVWPKNIFFSFLIFLHEVTARQVDAPFPIRSPLMTPFGLPDRYRVPMTRLWAMPLADWSFKIIQAAINNRSQAALTNPAILPNEAWMMAYEIALNKVKNFSQSVEEKAMQAEEKVMELETVILQMKAVSPRNDSDF